MSKNQIVDLELLKKVKYFLKFFNKKLARNKKTPYLCSEVLRFI